MSGDTTSDEEGSQEDSPRYDIDDLEIIKTIGEHTDPIHLDTFHWRLSSAIEKLSTRVHASDTRLEWCLDTQEFIQLFEIIVEIASKAILIDLRLLLLFANDDEEQVFVKANWMMQMLLVTRRRVLVKCQRRGELPSKRGSGPLESERLPSVYLTAR